MEGKVIRQGYAADGPWSFSGDGTVCWVMQVDMRDPHEANHLFMHARYFVTFKNLWQRLCNGSIRKVPGIVKLPGMVKVPGMLRTFPVTFLTS